MGELVFPDLPPLAALVVDDPFWRYPSDALAGEGIAHLRVWSCSSIAGGHLIAHQGAHLAVVSETGLGASIINSAEAIWAALADRFVGPLMLLEHWPASQDMTGEEHLDQVVINSGDGRPRWRRIWPAGPDDPQHQQLTAWMTAYGHTLLAASR